MVSPLDNSEDAPLPLGFTEFKDSITEEEFDWKAEGRAEFQRVFDGPWENRYRFIFDHIMPLVFEANGVQMFNSAAVFPFYPAARAYNAKISAKLVCSGKDEDNVIKHRLARITVLYGLPVFVDESGGGGGGNNDRLWVEETVESETEIHPLTARHFSSAYNQSSGSRHPSADQGGGADILSKPLTEAGKIPYRIVRFVYKLKLPIVFFPRWADIDYCLNGVNRAPFITPSGLYAPPGTLRYDGISSVTKRELQTAALAWTMEHKFTYYRPGWNTYPVIGEGQAAGKIIHADIVPPLCHFCYHQLIFVGLSIAQLNAWVDQFNNLDADIKRRFFDQGHDNPLRQEEVRDNFIAGELVQDIFERAVNA